MTITCTETTTTQYEVTPAEGWTRSDIVLALDQGRAVVRSDAILTEGEAPGSQNRIATVSSGTPKTQVAWR